MTRNFFLSVNVFFLQGPALLLALQMPLMNVMVKKKSIFVIYFFPHL